MRLAPLLSWLALAVAACAPGPKITVDYDRAADFSKLRTYTWVQPDTLPMSPLLWGQFVAAVDGELAQKGLVAVDSLPDIYISAFAGLPDETVVDTDRHGYGYGPGWYYGGAPMGSRTTVAQYTRGTLVVDLWDAETKRLVWRGTGSDIASDDPAVNAEKIRAGVQGMFRRYPPSASP